MQLGAKFNLAVAGFLRSYNRSVNFAFIFLNNRVLARGPVSHALTAPNTNVKTEEAMVIMQRTGSWGIPKAEV